MTAAERKLMANLAHELDVLSAAFYRAAGCEADATVARLYRKDFRRWDRLVAQARKLTQEPKGNQTPRRDSFDAFTAGFNAARSIQGDTSRPLKEHFKDAWRAFSAGQDQ
jgi:hypothetical protein